MRRLLLFAFLLLPVCSWAQSAALPIFVGQTVTLLPPTVDATGKTVVFASSTAPDGTSLGAVNVFLATADGSGLHQLTNLAGFTPGEATGANNLSFSANGALAAYTEAGFGLVVPPPIPSPAPNAPTPGVPAAPVGSEAIHLINISTGAEHIVTVNTPICVLPLEAAICFGCFPPSCLNTLHLTDDGSKVLVSMSGSEPFYVVNADGTGLTNLPVYSGQLAPSSQRVISGGGQIVFVSSSTSAPPSPPTPVPSPVPQPGTVVGGGGSGSTTPPTAPVPQPLPNIPTPAPVEDVYLVNMDGSNLQNATNFPANSSPSPANATISDDGKTIAFEGTVYPADCITNTNPPVSVNPCLVPFPSSPPVTQIWVVHSDGSALGAVTSGADASTQPSISGDGSLIAFVRAGQICLVHSDGSGLKVLTNFKLSAAHDPVISEDGSLIVFDIGPSNGGIGALYAIKADGTNLHPVYAPRSLSQNGIVGMTFGVAPSPGSLFSAYGINFTADSIAAASSFPLPTTLGGLSLLANGIPAPLLAVTPWQVNAQLSPDLFQGPVAFQLRFTDGASPPAAAADIQSIAPAIFLLPATGNIAPAQAAAFHANSGVPADQAHPAKAGDVLEIYGTGLGSTNPVVAAGTAAPSSPPAQTIVTPQVLIGNVSARVLFSGLTPSLAGVYQVNAVVPSGLKPGFQTVLWKIDNTASSNSGGITVQ